MTKHLRWMMVLLIGFGVALVPGALNGWSRPAPAFQGHSHEHENHGHDRDHHDNGRHRGWERSKKGYYRFNEYDRRQVRVYYERHRDDRWFRERPPRGFAFAYGEVIAPRYRRYCHPVPVVMMGELPPPPVGFRYFLFGGSVVMVDDGYRMHDFIHLDFNIGR